jgi:hypothetical protein
MAEHHQQFKVPNRYRPGLARFVRLSDEQLDALVAGLASGPPAADLEELAGNLADAVKLDPDELVDVLEMLASIQGAQAFFDTRPDAFLRGVVAAAEADPSIQFPKDRREKVENALREVIKSSRAIRVVARASELREETQRRLCPDNCRVITDIRPIFSSDVESKPDAAMVVHNLKIAYHEHVGPGVREFYVSPTGEDVRTLQDILQRAIAKEGSLREWLGVTSTPFLGVGE